MNTALSTALHSFHIKENPYLLCSAAIKFHNMTDLKLPTCHTDPVLLTFCKQDILYVPAMLSSNYIAATHNVTHSSCTSTCTTHPPLPSLLPSTTLLCTQLTSTKHSWQNGTRCRDDVNVLWYRSHDWSLRHALVFIRKTFFVTLII